MEPMILDDMVFSVRCHESSLKVIQGQGTTISLTSLQWILDTISLPRPIAALKSQIRATYYDKSLQAVFKITYSASIVPLLKWNLSLELGVWKKRTSKDQNQNNSAFPARCMLGIVHITQQNWHLSKIPSMGQKEGHDEAFVKSAFQIPVNLYEC